MDEYKLVQNEPGYWEFIRLVRNDPEIQKGFVEVVQITAEQQKNYMEKYNNNYFICLKDGEPVGYIGEIDDDIRVAVIVKEQRKGVGRFMVREFMKLRPNSYAKMKHDNVASKRLFESCDFNFVDENDKFKYYKKQ
jgi:RimJ/RimL family protein N-acetyltransferase